MNTNVEELVETTLPLAERIWQAAEQAGTYVAQQAVEHGPAAVDLAFAVVRVQALADLIFAPFLFVGAFASYKAASFFLREGRKEENRTKWDAPKDSYQIGFILGVVGVGTGLLVGVPVLLQVWAWVGLFYPEVWLAHAALEKLL